MGLDRGIMASPPLNRAMPICFTIFVLSALLLNALRSPQDPYRCDALSNDGNWFNGNGVPYTDWEPAGCMVRKYTRADIHRCVDGRPMIFSGDSTTSQVYWAMARLVSKHVPRVSPCTDNIPFSLTGREPTESTPSPATTKPSTKSSTASASSIYGIQSSSPVLRIPN
jgi:hypothetical protein